MVDDVKQSKKPEDNAFQQQRLKAWQPLLTPNWVIGTFGCIGPLFIIIGIFIIMASDAVVFFEARYDNLDTPTTSVSWTVPQDVEGPIYVYYKLTNYYQNHRRYVKSRSDAQLQGEKILAESDLDSCDPLITNPDDGKIMYPCGLIANSFFSDTFNATLDGVALEGDDWSSDEIAWASDKDKFVPVDYDDDDISRITTEGYKLPDVDSPDFMVWMRTAGLPTFKKLYRKINRDLKEGEVLEILADNTYDVAAFDGTKSIYISTASWLGGQNDFLGYAYLVVGIICVVLAIGFGIKHKVSPRDLGNMKYFNFPQINNEGN